MKTTALKEAGAKQESEWSWYTSGKECYVFSFNPPVYTTKVASSFDCHELLEGLPAKLQCSVKRCWQHTERYFASDSGYLKCVYEDTPAEALGKLKLWCLRNGHCDE